MSQALRILLAFFLFLFGVTFLHGWMNLDWFQGDGRKSLTVAHLPVT